MFDRIHRIITTKNRKKTPTKRFCNLYLSKLGPKLIDDKREEEKSKCIRDKIPIYIQETNGKEIALSLLFFIQMLTAYKGEEIT